MIRIICVGKLKEKYLLEATSEYLKRLQKYTNLELIEIMDEGLLDKETTLKKEKEKIERKLPTRSYLITLEIEGEQMDSLSFSKKVEDILMHYGDITFVIGGSYGLDASIKERADLHLSFSKLTFPHQLFRLLLLEQLYRSYKIQHNEKYHK